MDVQVREVDEGQQHLRNGLEVGPAAGQREQPRGGDDAQPGQGNAPGVLNAAME